MYNTLRTLSRYVSKSFECRLTMLLFGIYERFVKAMSCVNRIYFLERERFFF